MRKSIFLLYICCLLSIFSACKKDKPSDKLGNLGISDAYSLVLCKNDSVTDNPSDTLKLYKLVSDDRLYRVQYYSTEGGNLGYNYIPQAIYDISKEYFLLVVSKSGSSNSESYVINKLNGDAKELNSFSLPRKDDGVEINRTNNLFIKANSKTHFYNDEFQINKLSLEDENKPKITNVGTLDFNFAADSIGNYIIGKKLYCKSVNNGGDISYTIDEIDVNSVFCGNNAHGFYLVGRNTEKISIVSLVVSGYSYSIMTKGEIAKNITEWKYLGYASFSNSQSVILVFDLGLLYINAAGQQIINLSDFSISEIFSFSRSNNNLYIHGLNLIQSEVFIKLNPSTYPLTYSQLFTPNQFKYYFYEFDETGNFSFFAKRNSDSKEVTGYLSAAQIVNLVENDQRLAPRQILSIK